MGHPLRVWRTAAALLCLLLGVSPDLQAAGPVVAPNTVNRARTTAAEAVVKLYGQGASRVHGYGTGFLVSPDGKILTTMSTLVTGRIRAVLADGRQFVARLVRTDPYRQLALLEIDAEGLRHLELVKTDDLAIGDTVIAMGNWFKVADGEEPVSVNRGILGLKTNLDARRLTQSYDYHGPVLIYDAITANPGAPGGPLLDVDGHCVGIVGRIVEATGTNTRINYALPSEEILAFLGGSASETTSTQPAMALRIGKPYLGIKISKLGFRHVTAYVERVRTGSPAAEAGLKPDDLILAVDGKRIPDAAAYREAVDQLAPGQVVELVIKRGTQLFRVDVTVGEKK